MGKHVVLLISIYISLLVSSESGSWILTLLPHRLIILSFSKVGLDADAVGGHWVPHSIKTVFSTVHHMANLCVSVYHKDTWPTYKVHQNGPPMWATMWKYHQSTTMWKCYLVMSLLPVTSGLRGQTQCH